MEVRSFFRPPRRLNRLFPGKLGAEVVYMSKASAVYQIDGVSYAVDRVFSGPAPLPSVLAREIISAAKPAGRV